MKNIGATSNHVKRTSVKIPASNLAHCRVCGRTSRPPKAGEPDFSFEKILEHMENLHPEEVLGANTEFQIMLEQEEGHDEHCSFHGREGTK